MRKRLLPFAGATRFELRATGQRLKMLSGAHADVCAGAHMCHCTDRLLWARATGAGWISTGFDRTVYREQRRAWQLVSAARRAADHMVDGTIHDRASHAAVAPALPKPMLCVAVYRDEQLHAVRSRTTGGC